MGKKLRDAEHLVRLVAVLLVAVVAFLLLRNALMPPDYGRLGPYRPGALDDARNHPIKYAGQATCELCHDAAAAARKGGRHARIACETCHGPLAKHTEDPMANKPRRPEAAGLCARCHEADAAKPKSFPQVVSKEHSGGAPCNACHQAHRPKV